MLGRDAGPATPAVAAAFLVAVVAALVLTPAVRRVARRWGWLDSPDGVRKRHPAPVPRVGGLAVFAAFVLGLCAAIVALPPGEPGAGGLAGAAARLLLAATPVMLIGLLDDVRGVPPLAKIAVQAAAGLYLFLEGYRVAVVTHPFGGDPVELAWLSLPVTLLWFVAISNAFNLIDGLDGLAAGVALFAAATFLTSALLNERGTFVVVLCALAGAVLGFLRFNFPPATVFLGDSGALFVGFVVAGLAIPSSTTATAAVAVVAPLWALALPILDVLLALGRRLAAGQHPFEADEDHIHHRLIRSGLSPLKAVFALYGVAAGGACLSLAVVGGGTALVTAVACTAAALLWAGLRGSGPAGLRQAGTLLLSRYLRGGSSRPAPVAARQPPRAPA